MLLVNELYADKQLNHSKKDIQNAYDRIYLNIFVNLISAAAKCIGDTMGTSLHQPYLNQLQQSHPVIPLPHFLLHISTGFSLLDCFMCILCISI